MERSKRSLNVRMRHDDDDGRTRHKLEPQCVCNYQERQSKNNDTD